MAKYKQGIFKPRNPGKYKGDSTNICYRSAWELRLMSEFDTRSDVLWWSSEERIISYRSPIDGKIHRYFPDFLVRLKTKDGKEETVLIEVKPKAQTIEPKQPKEVNTRTNKKFLNEVMTWGVNKAKWQAAEEYCKDRGYRFIIMTEEHIFGNKK